jgi:2-oxoacid:acceptor oxidoreductase delta subunit (pyruvate/2-ketoisovalerate family)
VPGKPQKNIAEDQRKAAGAKKRTDHFSQIEHGLTEAEAIHEAERCLRSLACDSCDLCSLLCPDLCITRDQQHGTVLIDLQYCKGCGICAAVCPKGAISMVLDE